jgi:RpiR family transcriptional regulator, carbohydrate utilization regulator
MRPMNTNTALRLVRGALPSVGPGERRVLETVLDRAHEVAGWSTAELAAASGTSPATVVRACQTAGFRGYQHLRLELARSVEDLGPGSPGTAAADSVFDRAAHAVERVRRDLDRDVVARAAAVLAAAPRVLFVGNGFSSPPLQDAAMRWATIGRPVEAPVDVLAQQFAAHASRPGDACLVVSFSGANTHTVRAARAASDRGATVIAVTSFLRTPLTKIADAVIIAGPAEHEYEIDPYVSRLGHHLALHVLHAAVRDLVEVDDLGGMRDVVSGALTDGTEA